MSQHDMFPPEIIDHVLSFLQWDHATLKVCTRAHPSLSNLVERHFYRHLTVQNYGHCQLGAYRHVVLLKCIVDNPNIANHVRSLRIRVVRFRDSQALESILPMLTQLRVISLSSASVWDDLSESFRTAFTNCLRLPTLTHLELSNIDRFPLSALDHASSLKRLSLSGDFRYSPTASPLVYSPLDFLDLCIRSTSIEIIASWLESRTLALRSLKFSGGPDLSSRLFGVCANTLTTLIVHVPPAYTRQYMPPNDPTPIPLSYLPQLARLTVHIPILFTRFCQRSYLPDAMQLLDTLPSPPTNLILLIISVEIMISPFGDIYDTDWSPLIPFPYFDIIPRVELRVRAHESETYLPSVLLLKTLKRDPRLIQLEMHPSFVINAVENPVGRSWFDFGSDLTDEFFSTSS